jgi:outer membrane protein
MKKILFTVFAAFVAFGASAQIEKGTILAGASSNLGYNSFTPKDADAITAFNIDLKGGYFIIDNLALGLNIGFSSQDDSNSDTKTTSTALGVFARYYIQGKIFIEGGFDSYKDKDESGGSEFESSYTGINIGVGYAAFITDNIAVEPALGYTSVSGDFEGSGFGINVGFTLYLNRGGN